MRDVRAGSVYVRGDGSTGHSETIHSLPSMAGVEMKLLRAHYRKEVRAALDEMESLVSWSAPYRIACGRFRRASERLLLWAPDSYLAIVEVNE